MRRFYALGFLVLITFDTGGQIAFKIAADATAPAELSLAWLLRLATEPWIYVTACGFLGSFVTWMTLLSNAPVGPAFAASHMEIVAVLLVSVTILGETLTGRQVVGAILIIAGVALLGWYEGAEASEMGGAGKMQGEEAAPT